MRPTSLTKAWIREHHAFTGHIGAKRLWLYLREHFEFFDMGYAEKFTEKIMRQCETCQATQRIHRLVGPMEATPMPHRPMQHVALDLFFMTPVKEGDKVFDMMAVCVDRHSGWTIAIPCQNKGLTGKKVAMLMLKEWRIFGIPSILTSDQGSHFTSEWWKTMCAELGIRHTYSQAYHHRANGRVEMAGQQIKEYLRKILTEEKHRTWVDALPQALDRLHDAKGQCGLSPYEILFGRSRPLGNIPYEPDKD